jgi:hypothetical protein
LRVRGPHRILRHDMRPPSKMMPKRFDYTYKTKKNRQEAALCHQSRATSGTKEKGC